jgi:hypothetical protein
MDSLTRYFRRGTPKKKSALFRADLVFDERNLF